MFVSIPAIDVFLYATSGLSVEPDSARVCVGFDGGKVVDASVMALDNKGWRRKKCYALLTLSKYSERKECGNRWRGYN